MKKIVITGYSSLIALELCRLLDASKAQLRVLRCGRSENIDFNVDFAQYDQTESFVEWLRREQPDYVFLNHGVLPGSRMTDTDREVRDRAFRVNLASFALILEALPDLPETRTVVMSSVSGKAGSYDTLYAACKAGVDVVVKQTAAKLMPGARLNAVSPGIVVDAKMTLARKDVDVLESKRQQTPTRQFTTSNDVAKLVYYMLFESENLQGANVNINGGIYVP